MKTTGASGSLSGLANASARVVKRLCVWHNLESSQKVFVIKICIQGVPCNSGNGPRGDVEQVEVDKGVSHRLLMFAVIINLRMMHETRDTLPMFQFILDLTRLTTC